MTYQTTAKAKAREGFANIADTEIFAENGKEQIEITDDLQETLDTLVSQTITDLLDELEKEMGEEKSVSGLEYKHEVIEAEAYNYLHRKLTKKFNQIRM